MTKNRCQSRVDEHLDNKSGAQIFPRQDKDEIFGTLFEGKLVEVTEVEEIEVVVPKITGSAYKAASINLSWI